MTTHVYFEKTNSGVVEILDSHDMDAGKRTVLATLPSEDSAWDYVNNESVASAWVVVS